jgi:catechol 2,3-dioxygenase-like lactoylglutathione lyase family enzyme
MTTMRTERPAGSGASANAQRVVPFKMAHLVYRCRRREETVEWYLQMFQAHIVFKDDVLTFITYDDEHHRLAFFNMPDIPPKGENTAGVHHVAYSFRVIGELLGTYARLKGVGILPYWCVNHGPTTSMYFRDPEGNDIEFQVDNGDEPSGYFHSEEFARNPIGVEFDPDLLLQMWRDGASDAELGKVGTAATGRNAP